MRLEILEFNMFLLSFGIFAGIILNLILICVWGIFKKDDSNNKDTLYRHSDMGTNKPHSIRKYRSNNRYNSVLSKNDPETIIEDLIICDMVGIL